MFLDVSFDVFAPLAFFQDATLQTQGCWLEGVNSQGRTLHECVLDTNAYAQVWTWTGPAAAPTGDMAPDLLQLQDQSKAQPQHTDMKAAIIKLKDLEN